MKKIINTIAVCLLVASAVSFQAFAQGNISEGNYMSEDYSNSENTEYSSESLVNLKTSASLYEVRDRCLRVPYYKEPGAEDERNDIGASATVLQTLDYLGYTGEKDVYKIKNKLGFNSYYGIDHDKMLEFINENQSEGEYVKRDDHSIQNLNHFFNQSIAAYVPPIIEIRGSTSKGWEYNSTGNWMNVTAVVDGANYWLTDPYIQWVCPYPEYSKGLVYHNLMQIYDNMCSDYFIKGEKDK